MSRSSTRAREGRAGRLKPAVPVRPGVRMLVHGHGLQAVLTDCAQGQRRSFDYAAEAAAQFSYAKVSADDPDIHRSDWSSRPGTVMDNRVDCRGSPAGDRDRLAPARGPRGGHAAGQVLSLRPPERVGLLPADRTRATFR